ncbi:helix-turn-helix domain-containing protein [Mesorhizobium sp. YR577]|uniref:helix-turn-helix domain-containing protein n=1 Tax=Mesorhizobium sp. YR577 TaxID=1884373 RepID=UPI0008F07224|nr:helix-turn-helix domain-containing protein [Mesorhizobium sp. YR577]SFU16329.1 transcriptional regulator, AraC family [Mesorhizobium sp. YR577]
MMKDDYPTLLFKTDTRAISLKKALEFWEESAGSLYDFNIFQTNEFHTTHCTFRFGEVLLTHCASVAQRLSRSNYRIGADGYDHFEIQFFIDGRWRRHDGREENYAGPGDVIVHDAAQAHAGSASNFCNLTLFVPRPLLARLLINPDEHNMRVLAAHEPMVGLLRNHIDSLFRILPQLDEKQAATLVAPTLELIAAALNGVPREDSIQGIAGAQLASIRRYIDGHALEPDLSPFRIAANFTISLRKLAYLFSNDGGVASYIQERRLNMARSALRDPAQAHKSIGEIGLEHGFTYPHNFTRAFQRLYCITPRETRAVAQRHRMAGTSESQNWFDRASQWGR